MSKLIYTSYSPNTRVKDLVLNVGLLFRPWLWKNGAASKNIRDLFEAKYPGSKAFTFNYARSGMTQLFKALGLGANDEVLVQGFTCVAAVNPVLWAGAEVKYVDVDHNSLNMDLEDLKSKITASTKVVMFQYTFGNSAGMDEVVQLCKEKDLILIEDCTNTIFGKHQESYIGSFGVASIFSFGRDKAISGVDGGLILVNDNSLKVKMEEYYENLNMPQLKWIRHELIYPLIWAKIKATFTFFKLGKLVHLVSTKLGLIGKATSDNEKNGKSEGFLIGKYPNALAVLAENQLKDIEEINNHRILITNIYESEIKVGRMVNREDGNVLLRFPLLVDSKKELFNYLSDRHIILGDWYSQPVDPGSVNLKAVGYDKGMCKVSEEICEQIVNLPTHINVTEKDAHKLAKLINDFYGN